MLHHALDQPIPHDWSVDQAVAVVELLVSLAERIWSRYGLAIRDSYPPAPPSAPPHQLALPFPPPWEHS